MKLYQALKLKNKLAGEIKELESFIQVRNSNLTANDSKFNLDEKLEELSNKRLEMISLKTKINKANQGIIEKIYTLSELKSQHKFWSNIPTKEGSFKEGYGTAELTTYKSHFNEVMALNNKNEFQKLIEKVQEELDVYNHTTDIEE